MNLKPRQRFKDTAYSKIHYAAVASDWFQAAAEAAMVEYQLRISANQENPNKAVSLHANMVGAKEYLNIFMNLSEVDQSPLEAPRKNLYRDENKNQKTDTK